MVLVMEVVKHLKGKAVSCEQLEVVTEVVKHCNLVQSMVVSCEQLDVVTEVVKHCEAL